MKFSGIVKFSARAATALLFFPLAILPPRTVAAQARDVTPAPISNETKLARAWTAFAASRHAEAARLCDEILASPTTVRHDALALKIRAEAARGSVVAALDAYERWTTRRRDPALLAPVGEYVLGTLTSAADPGLRALAISRLRRAGRNVPSADGSDLEDRAAGGDAAARDQLLQGLTSGALPPRAAMVESLADGGASPAQLSALLTQRSPDVRAAAIDAIARGSAPEVVQALAPLRDDPDPYIRLKANVALARAGDTAAAGVAREALSSPVGDVRLMAAEAFPHTPESIAAIRGTLDDSNPLNRLKAAQLLAPDEPSLSVFSALVSDANPAVRMAAARVAAETFPEELSLMRPMLLSSEPWSQAYAAAALLRAGDIR